MVLLQLLPALALAIAFAGLFVHGADTYYAIAQKNDAKNVALTFDDGQKAGRKRAESRQKASSKGRCRKKKEAKVISREHKAGREPSESEQQG
jgi:hypothetical protein